MQQLNSTQNMNTFVHKWLRYLSLKALCSTVPRSFFISLCVLLF